MSRYIIRRILVTVPVLFGVTLITFIIINASGSPLARYAFNPKIKPEDIERIKQNLGLDKPVVERYFIWMGNLLQGDLGYSMINGSSVTARIGAVLPNTLTLAVLSILVALIIAVPVGIYAAVHRNSVADRVATTLAVAGFAIPTVWLSLMLIILFAVKFREWGFYNFPVGGVKDSRGDGGFVDRVEHLILPVLALAIPQVAGWIVYIRSSMLEVIRQDYIRTAEAKGLKFRRVVYGHGFRNALLPLVTLVGLSIPELFGGALIVENVFAYPGMGRLTVEAVGQRDYTIIMGTTLLYAALVILGNLIADVLYVVLDPRIRID